jgi:DNA repair exonuclease SbcCD ATPase subunit
MSGKFNQMVNQIQSLQDQLKAAIASRGRVNGGEVRWKRSLWMYLDMLAGEVLKLSAQTTDLQEQTTRIPAMERDLEELRARYSAALEMLGEKTEKVEELQADIEDMREIYRTQIEELTRTSKE